MTKRTFLLLLIGLGLTTLLAQATPRHPVKDFTISRRGRHCVEIKVHVVGAGTWQLRSAPGPGGPFNRLEAIGKSGKPATVLLLAGERQRFFQVVVHEQARQDPR